MKFKVTLKEALEGIIVFFVVMLLCSLDSLLDIIFNAIMK